jgi:hypothetical protein
MNTIYPYDLLFDLHTDDPRRRAILLAAVDLELTIATDGTQIHVRVRSPQETYRFGQRTGDFLDGQAAPTPVKVTPASTETK